MRAYKADLIPVRLLLGALLLLVLAFPLSASAEIESVEGPSLPQLRDVLKKGLLEGDLIPLRPVLNELSDRTEGEAEREGYVFLLGLSYQDEFSTNKSEDTLRKAMSYYRQYVDLFPQGTRRAYVRFNLACAHADLGEFDEAIVHYDWLFRRSKNAVLRLESRDRMCRLYMKHGKADQGIPLFLEVFNGAVLDDELRAQAASWLLQGYLAAGNPEAIPPYLRYLTGDTEAVYDPNFNITLLKAGDKLFDAEAYDQAILLYSFVKPKSQIVSFYDALTDKLRARLSYLSPESDTHTILTGRLQTAEANLRALDSVREYDVDMQWRIARVFLETERNWEALWAFYHLYQDYPEHPQREDFCYISFSEARATGDPELIAQIANAYLDEDDFLKYRNQITLGLADAYLKSNKEADFLTLFDAYLKEPEDNLTAAQLINKLALLYTADGRFKALFERMAPLLEELAGKEPAHEASRYWYAFAALLLTDFVTASANLEAFTNDYAEGPSLFIEDASYRYGISLYGEARNAEAETQFAGFVNRYPDSRLRGEAELYLGDLKRARGLSKEAIVHYETVSIYTENQEFISKAVFAISEVHLALGESESAYEVIEIYLEEYGEFARSVEAIYRLGGIREQQGQIAERFRIHRDGIRENANEPERHAVDDLILAYVTDYTRVEESLEISIELLERLVADPSFRKSFLEDRVFQYGYLQNEDGLKVDPALNHALVRDRAVRARLIESESVTNADVDSALRGILSDYMERLSSVGEYDATELFTDLYASSSADASQLTLNLRARMALDKLGQLPTGLPSVSDKQLQKASPSLLLWQADAHYEQNPERAEVLYHTVIQRYPLSKSATAALQAMARIAYAGAQEGADAAKWEQALRFYDQLSERTPNTSPSAQPLLERAEILVELARDPEAIHALSSILQNPSWRGLDHAKAHLALGKIYLSKEQWQEAHGFFERLIVAYGGYFETVSWAYYYDLRALEALDETESMQQLLAEYRSRIDAFRGTEAYERIEEAYDL